MSLPQDFERDEAWNTEDPFGSEDDRFEPVVEPAAQAVPDDELPPDPAIDESVTRSSNEPPD